MNTFSTGNGFGSSWTRRRGWNWPNQRLSGLALVVLSLFSRPMAAPAEDLFSAGGVEPGGHVPILAARRARQAALNPASTWSGAMPAVTPARTMVLNLFSDLVVTGALETVASPGPGRSVLRGHLEGLDGSFFLLARESNVVSGAVFLPQRGTFLIQYAGGGKHRILELDPAHVAGCGVEAAGGPAEGARGAPQPWVAAEKEPQAASGARIPVVDVLVLYTPQARDGAGGDSGISTLIDLAVAEANLAYENSQVNLVLRLAAKAKVDYDETGNLSRDLTRLITPHDGYLDQVGQLRTNANADLVCLLVESSTPMQGVEVAGIAVQNATAATAFSVVQRPYAVGRYVFAHELGHNFGCQHDRADAASHGWFADSYGWVFQAGFWTYGTVMSYPGQRIPYFSNPSVQYLGVATGVASGTNAANNARTLNARAATLAAFRAPAASTYAPAVSITNPANQAVLGYGTNVAISASASVRGDTISRVDFYAGDSWVGSSPGPAYQCVWTNPPVGVAALTAHAISSLGVETVSASISVEVKYLNDNFANPQELSGTNFVLSFGNAGTTMEPGEPQPYGAGACSVWFAWTAPQSGGVLYSLPGHDFAAYLGIFTGDNLTNLALVSGTPSGYPTIFQAEAGQTYHIVIGGYADSVPSGQGTLQWQQFAAFTNDAFADATSVSGTSFRTRSDNVGATAEPGEGLPGFYGSGHSVWWQWTAPANGWLAISGGAAEGLLAVCLGDSVSNLVLVAQGGLGSSGYSSVLQVPVCTGQTYHIMVDGASGWMGDFDLGWDFSPGPPPAVAADFANRTILTGPNLTTPVPAGAASTWFSWTAPSDGQLSFDTGDTNTLAGVFAGDTAEQLSWLGQWGAAGSLMVTAGTTYQIQVVNPPGGLGSLALHFVQYVSGTPNDNFANALLLDGSQVAVYAGNAGAGREAGEPRHAGYDGLASVWFTWTAPADGVLDVRLECAGSFFGLLGVYTGPSVTNLTCLGQGAFAFPFTAWPEALVPVTNGASLDIAVDGFAGAWRLWGMSPVGNFTLRLNLLPHPANDNFAQRETLIGTNVTVTASNALASSEPGEPPLGSGHSLWWTWTAPQDGLADLSFDASSFPNRVVGVYTGNSLTQLTRLNSGNGARFAARAGTTYQIAVDGQSGASGDFVLQLSLGPKVQNDNFADRIVLPDASGTVAAYNWTATTEAGEPDYGVSIPVEKTVWWSWTAPAKGRVTFSVAGNFEWVMGVFTNSTLPTLQRVATASSFGPQSLLLEARAGESFQIAVGSRDGSEADFTLSYFLAPYPPNDNFSDRITLVGENVSGAADDTYATSEPGEPDHAGWGCGRSVWWSWTAPRTMRMELDNSYGSVVAVYTGDSLNSLSCVASNAGAGKLRFDAVSEVSYQVALDTAASTFFTVVSFTLSPAPVTPPNDFFANRALLAGTNAADSGYEAEATSEPGEPVLGSGRTLWWTWTAPGNGRVNLSFGAGCASQVFTGDELTNLTLIASNPAGVSLSFSAVSNFTYQISLDAVPTYPLQNVSLTLTLVPAPPNDNFADAIRVAGTTCETNGSSAGATSEYGEPLFAGTSGAASIWWKWTAPETQRMTLFASGQTEDGWANGFTVGFGVFTGNSVASLNSVCTGAGQGRFQAIAGTTYYFALAGTNGAFGRLDLRLVPTPLNDDFADRQLIQGYSISLSGTTDGASKEPGEPDHAFEDDGASVWFSWTAPNSGTAHLQHNANTYYSCAAVYTGSVLTNLTKIASECWGWQVDFPVQGGLTYQIALAGYYANSGPYTMALWLDAGAANDNFANRIPLVGTNLTIEADNTLATREPGEPRHAGDAGGHSVWWSYPAPMTGSLRIDFSSLGFVPDIGIYTGTALSSLKPVTNATDYVKGQSVFNTLAGTVYQIAVDGYQGATGDILLRLDEQPAPVNDYFSGRAGLPSAAFSITANNRGATREPGEPNHDGLSGAHSLWWCWTAPTSQPVCLTASGNGFECYLAVYAGATLATLAAVGSNYSGGVLQPQVIFSSVKGQTYQIALDSAFADFGDLSLALSPLPPPPNDDFAEALVLTGRTATALGTNGAATSQPGEPAHAGQPASHSLWWQWRPQVSGPVTINTVGSSFDTVLAVYTGGSLSALAPVASNDDLPSGGDASQVNFNAVAGTRYWIAVDGFDGAVGVVSLQLSATNAAPLVLRSAGLAPESGLKLRVEGAPTQFFLLQTSTNLLAWTTLSTNQLNRPAVDLELPVAGQCPSRFYRIIPWP